MEKSNTKDQTIEIEMIVNNATNTIYIHLQLK